MKRFIFVTFLFLGWVFYELSDGSDFQPRSPDAPVAGIASAASAPKDAAPTVHQVPNPTTTKTRPFAAVSLVAKPAITPPKPVVAAPAVATPAQETSYDRAVAAATLEQVRSSFGQGLTLFASSDAVAQPLTLASLEQEAVSSNALATDTLADGDTPAPVAFAEPLSDTREITGTRVNMRDGPGTIYPIIVRLNIGQEVEVLGDSGTGWLRLRSMPDQQIGWVSASLVSKANR